MTEDGYLTVGDLLEELSSQDENAIIVIPILDRQTGRCTGSMVPASKLTGFSDGSYLEIGVERDGPPRAEKVWHGVDKHRRLISYD